MQITTDATDRRVTIVYFNPTEVVKKCVEPEATYAYWYNENAMSAYDGNYVFRFTVDEPRRRAWWQFFYPRLLRDNCEWFQLRMQGAELFKILGFDGTSKYPIYGYKNLKLNSDYKTGLVEISGTRMSDGVALKVKLRESPQATTLSSHNGY